MKAFLISTCALLLSVLTIQAQEVEIKKDQIDQEKIHIKIKDGIEPDIYVDGKKFEFDMELIDKDQIESINVIKGEKAKKEYNSDNGVVLITTKKNLVELDGAKVKIKTSDKNGSNPKILVDGKPSNRDALKKLDPDQIESIEVVKDKVAIEKYQAPNGVVIIKTKKGGQ